MITLINLLSDAWNYLKYRKRYWLVPLLITITIFVVFSFISKGPVLAPFIYNLTN